MTTDEKIVNGKALKAALGAAKAFVDEKSVETGKLSAANGEQINALASALGLIRLEDANIRKIYLVGADEYSQIEEAGSAQGYSPGCYLLNEETLDMLYVGEGGKIQGYSLGEVSNGSGFLAIKDGRAHIYTVKLRIEDGEYKNCLVPVGFNYTDPAFGLDVFYGEIRIDETVTEQDAEITDSIAVRGISEMFIQCCGGDNIDFGAAGRYYLSANGRMEWFKAVTAGDDGGLVFETESFRLRMSPDETGTVTKFYIRLAEPSSSPVVMTDDETAALIASVFGVEDELQTMPR